jgi:hypothetical protein
VAKDKAVFALSEDPTRWNLTIKSGHVDFAIGMKAKLINFLTPHDNIVSQELVIPASTDSQVVRGSVIVTDEKTELVIHNGAMRVSTREGSKLIRSGHSITLAQAFQTMDDAGTAKGSGAGAGAGNSPGSETFLSTKGILIAGGVLAAIGVGVALGGGGGGSGNNPRPVSRY